MNSSTEIFVKPFAMFISFVVAYMTVIFTSSGMVHAHMMYAHKVGLNQKDDIINKLKEKDEVVSKGTFIYIKKSVLKPSSHISSPVSTKQTLAFTADRHFIRTYTTSASRSTKPIVQLYDGLDEMVIDGKYVVISSGEPYDLGTSSKMIGLNPGPCFVFGRGLSTLQNFKIFINKNDVIIKGQALDGTTVEAILDPKHNYIAKKINRRYKGKVIGKIVLGAPFMSDHRELVASRASYEAYKPDGHTISKDEYILASADFSNPPASTFYFPLSAGSIVTDLRLGKAITWKIERKTNKEHLLERTRRKITDLAYLEAEVQKSERNELTKRYLLFLLPIFLLIAFLTSRYLHGHIYRN